MYRSSFTRLTMNSEFRKSDVTGFTVTTVPFQYSAEVVFL